MSMGKMSKEKGKRFERFVVGLFKEYGYDARRSAQFCGKSEESADVVGVPGLSVECKAQERMHLYEWMEQAVDDAQINGRRPVVIHKQNNKDVLVTMRFTDWIELYREWEAGYPWNK